VARGHGITSLSEEVLKLLSCQLFFRPGDCIKETQFGWCFVLFLISPKVSNIC